MFMEAAGILKIPGHPKRPVPSEYRTAGFDFFRNRVRIIRIKNTILPIIRTHMDMPVRTVPDMPDGLFIIHWRQYLEKTAM